MKNLVVCQKARLLTTLASLNNDHNSDLRACCLGMRSLSRPNLDPAKPLRPHNTAWRSSFVANLSSTTSGHVHVVKVEACAIAGHCHVATTTLVRNFIWPCNNFVLNYYTNSFSISPSLASKPMKRRLSLCSSYLGASVKVSTTRLTT
jgi:hypothetical protein